MIPLKLGRNQRTGKPLYVPRSTFATHWHLIGGTGAGKTTALLGLLFPILMNCRKKATVFVIDGVGGLTLALNLWMASPRHCPEHVRRRYVCIEPAREEYVLPFNPLLCTSQANEYYQVEQAVDTVLRAWESQDLSVMPRLRKWTFNAFLAAIRMGFPIAMCRFLLQPGTDEHKALLNLIPGDLRYEWSEIFNTRGQETVRILESTRNRLGPFFDSVIFRRTFGSVRNHFDVEQFIRDKNVVVVNVSPGENQLPGHLGRTYGSLVVNQILSTARYLNSVGRPAEDVFVVLDEFQQFVGPDLMEAIPTLRQMGIHLVLANQSFSQLVKGDLDLNGIIWQARSRMIFANDAEDADRLAHEVATLTWNPDTIKHQLVTTKQRIAGHRKVLLNSSSRAASSVKTWNEQDSVSRSSSEARSNTPDSLDITRRDTSGTGYTSGSTAGGSSGLTETAGQSESLVPVHQDVEEVTNVTFQGFDEFRTIKAAEIRRLLTGQALVKFVNDPNVYHVAVEKPTVPNSRRMQDALAALSVRNLNSGLFVPASEIDREAEELRQKLLQPPSIQAVSNGRSKPVVPQGGNGDYRFDDD